MRHATRRSLGDNQLTTLPAGIFDALTSLQYLCVWGQVAGGGGRVPSGTHVGGRIDFLPMWVALLLMVWSVLLCDPRRPVSHLATQRECTRHATHRWLNNNQLATLPAGIFDALTSLTQLYVWGLVAGGTAA